MSERKILERLMDAAITAGLDRQCDAYQAALDYLDTIPALNYADLINDETELQLRKAIRMVMKSHDMVDGVIEADLTSALKGLMTPAPKEKARD